METEKLFSKNLCFFDSNIYVDPMKVEIAAVLLVMGLVHVLDCRGQEAGD